MELGKIITEIRKQNKMTQEELAEKFHVTRQTISNWENGKSYPDIETLVCISNEFDVPLDIMLKGDKDMVSVLTKEQQQGKKQKKRIVLTVIIVIIVMLGGLYILNNTSTEVSPEDYTITVRKITLDDVIVDNEKNIATYKDFEGVASIEGQEYTSLMTSGKIYQIIVIPDKAIDCCSIGSHYEDKALDITVGRSNSIFRAHNSNKIVALWLEDFDKIYDGDRIVWEK